MDPKIIARAAAVILLGGAVLACALELARQGRTLNSSLPAAHDNLDFADELARCAEGHAQRLASLGIGK